MIPEIGSVLLCLALGLAVLLSFYPLWGVARNDARLMASSRPLAWLLFLCVTGAFLVLVNAFVVNDFSVTYVANNSNTQLPIWYRVAATWGAHEGSLLLWVLLMSGWTFAVAICSYRMPLDIVARVLAVMGMVSVGFLLFIIFTSNPFSRTLPAFPIEGRDLNPLLQDPGLIFHPPLLYMGYVGFSVAFAFAIAALLSGRLDSSFTRFARPWTMAAWFFLTLGIMLGSAWAYYELGWGGWWFWDPVENASFMPWLVGTALIHSLSVTEQRATFKAWSLLLSIFAFSLCLLGTFLVRSGVLVSVHAFASDPSRGLFILAFMVLVIGGSLLVFALRGHKVRSRVNNALWSRESMLLGNNVILTAAMLVVLLGTLLPLVHKQIGLGTISIGEPFFNTMFIALMVPFALLLGIGPLVRWGRDRPAAIKKLLIIATVLTVILSFALPLLMEDRVEALTVVGLMMACWIAILAFAEMRVRISKKIKLTPSYWGMVLAHLGLAVTIVGIAFSQNYSIERDVKMKPGDSISIRAYTFVFNGVREADGPNYQGVIGSISVKEKDKVIGVLMPEKRFYSVSRAVMTEAAIDGGFTRDLYAALGEEIAKDTWTMRLYYKPFVRWIWSGGVLMAIGALFCLFDPRYRRRKLQGETAWTAKSS
ncbi:heme lyase CcmF/NrfE family subunit [Providencia rettgeri]|nr:heme lyase CcmF/NrfE family subunit [Providencia rettgeri]MDI7243016.1 heme lyase CcmF/NrfE family subunit [Providencia rettgeri]MDK3109735.1 heme lyase CcmF/NrfE family subunit [Providencia rettgeri]MDK7744533.1 heme lyase CcmF/NrfE family subunit [Providencia rettgeri]MDK7757255.1 heme lyase CcmF/NrfE family subunit [Providencia rettgeri]MDL9983405.1 heme lyase CcmF/NrfE family subunit [Providencia rettgeri]